MFGVLLKRQQKVSVINGKESRSKFYVTKNGRFFHQIGPTHNAQNKHAA
jgi:hypothetical protein